MTVLDGLVFALILGSVPFAIAGSNWIANVWWRRAGLALAFALVALNVQLDRRAWQSVVILVLAVVVALITQPVPRALALLVLALGGSFLLRPGVAGDANDRFFSPDRVQIFLVIAGLLVVVIVGSVVVELTIKSIRGLPQSSEAAEGAGRAGGAPAGGKTIGMLERALIYGAVLVGHPEAVALVVAVKSVARFPEFDKDRAFAEYFLIGTLLSISFALAVAYLVKVAMAAAP